MFNLTNLDKICVQATHLEERGKFIKEEKNKNVSNPNNSKRNKGKERTTSTTQKEKSKDVSLIIREKVI